MMKKRLNILFVAAVVMISLNSCRETTDNTDDVAPMQDEMHEDDGHMDGMHEDEIEEMHEEQPMDDTGAMETDDHM